MHDELTKVDIEKLKEELEYRRTLVPGLREEVKRTREYGDLSENDEYKCAFSTSSPLCGIKVKVKKINWGLLPGFEYVPDHLPQSTTPIGEEEEITFVPYACAKLRMTELPLLKK